MSIEAMKQAIEAFEELKREVTRDGTVSENWDAYYAKEYHALEALRKAVEEAEKQEHQFKYTPYGLRADESGKLSIGELPRKEWVGLTDDDLRQIILASIGVAEAKLKEKNT